MNQTCEQTIVQELNFSFAFKDLLEVAESIKMENSNVYILYGIDYQSRMWSTINTKQSLESPRTFAQQLKFEIPAEQYLDFVYKAKENSQGLTDFTINLYLGITKDQKVSIGLNFNNQRLQLL